MLTSRYHWRSGRAPTVSKSCFFAVTSGHSHQFHRLVRVTSQGSVTKWLVSAPFQLLPLLPSFAFYVFATVGMIVIATPNLLNNPTCNLPSLFSSSPLLKPGDGAQGREILSNSWIHAPLIFDSPYIALPSLVVAYVEFLKAFSGAQDIRGTLFVNEHSFFHLFANKSLKWTNQHRAWFFRATEIILGS